MCQAVACEECALNCLLIHKQKRDPSPITISFVKCIVENTFSHLFVPSKFSKSLASLENKETLLEDSIGRRWTVDLSYVNGRLAIKNGWRAFCLDHGVGIGDILVFYYIFRSHFVVHIYGKNSCEKLSFPAETMTHSKKRANKTTVDLNKDCWDGRSCNFSSVKSPFESRVDAIKKNVQEQNAKAKDTAANTEERYKRCEVVASEEPFFLVNRDVSTPGQDDRSSLLDMSIHENIGAIEKIDICEIQGIECFHVTEKAAKSSDSGESLADTGMVKGNNLVGEKVKEDSTYHHACTTEVPQPLIIDVASAIEDGMEDMDISEEPNPDVAILGQKRGGTPSEARLTYSQNNFQLCEPSSLQSPKFTPACDIFSPASGVMPNGTTGNPNQKFENEALQMVKVEAVDFSEALSPLAVTCLVTQESEFFLEMSTGLPSFSSKTRRVKEKVVFLQDPDRRLWPVYYHDKHGFKALACGWRSFREANQIQPGDECVFSPKDEMEGIYKVQIVNK